MYVSTYTAEIVDRVITIFSEDYLISSKGEILDSNLKVVENNPFSNREIALGVLNNFIPNTNGFEYFCWIDGIQENCAHQNLMWISKPVVNKLQQKVFGPYKRKDGRKHVVITFSEEGSNQTVARKTVSYPKFLKEQELGLILYPPLTVDHHDCDFTNDRLENLKILIRTDHVKNDVKRRNPVSAFCVECGKQFNLTRGQIGLPKRETVKSGPFCSKSCRGKFSREVQLKRRTPKLELYYKNVTYYSNKQLLEP